MATDIYYVTTTPAGGRLNKKDGLTRYGPNGRLIFNMEIAIHR